MKAIIKNGELRFQNEFNVLLDSNNNQTSINGLTDIQWEEHGFKEVISPTYDINTQTLGKWYETNTEIRREIIEKTPEDLIIELLVRKEYLTLKYEKDTDNLINDIIGSRASEYSLAEKEAILFKNEGYPDNNVPLTIESDAIANNRTNQESCDLIILMANNWKTTQYSLRAKRLLIKAETKKAISNNELIIIESNWDNFINDTKNINKK